MVKRNNRSGCRIVSDAATAHGKGGRIVNDDTTACLS